MNSQAIDLDPADATLLSNRSLCWIRVGQAELALADAKACRALRPDWAKACYREGAALRLLQACSDDPPPSGLWLLKNNHILLIIFGCSYYYRSLMKQQTPFMRA